MIQSSEALKMSPQLAEVTYKKKCTFSFEGTLIMTR